MLSRFPSSYLDLREDLALSFEKNIRWVQQGVKAALATTAVYLLWQGRHNDLSDARARIRLMLIGGMALRRHTCYRD